MMVSETDCEALTIKGFILTVLSTVCRLPWIGNAEGIGRLRTAGLGPLPRGYFFSQKQAVLRRGRSRVTNRFRTEYRPSFLSI